MEQENQTTPENNEIEQAEKETRETQESAGSADQKAEVKDEQESQPQKPSFFRRIWEWLKSTIPGVVLCAVIAVPSWFLGMLVPVIGSAVFAIVIGMIIAFFPRPKWLDAGIRFTSKKILQASIVFLGFGMQFMMGF